MEKRKPQTTQEAVDDLRAELEILGETLVSPLRWLADNRPFTFQVILWLSGFITLFYVAMSCILSITEN